MNLNVSLVVTTYNWPSALDAVLRSIENQQCRPNEVIIADDGSTEETSDIIKKWASKSSLNIRHVWQEDNGFQAAKIRNKAASLAKGDYIIFLDGDCLLRPDFIAQHKRLALKGYFVAGNRVLFSSSFTDKILNHQIEPEGWEPSQYSSEQINRTWPLRYVPLGILRKRAPNKWQGVKTCNLGVWKSDLILVNGLDEAFIGWGYEDSDLVIRLLRAGVKHLNGRLATTVLHLWHHENDRSQEQENWAKLQEVLNGDKKLAEKGIDQYL